MIDRCPENESHQTVSHKTINRRFKKQPEKRDSTPVSLSHFTTSPEKIEASLEKTFRAIAPAWPLKDMVAVNPFTELADRSLLSVHKNLRQVRDTQLLMPLEYYQTQFDQGLLTHASIQEALDECSRQFPDDFDGVDWEVLEMALAANAIPPSSQRTHFTIAEMADEAAEAPRWVSVVLEEISKYCSAYFDEGQAIWNATRRATDSADNLYSSWKQLAAIDRRLEFYGLKGFRELVSDLPDSPTEAIRYLTKACKVPENAIEPFWQASLFSVAGWASYAKYADRTNKPDSLAGGELTSLLAIRMAYDFALIQLGAIKPSRVSWASKLGRATVDSRETKIRYVLQSALEVVYRSQLIDGILSSGPAAQQKKPQSTDFNLVFCIDVRSEVIRRHLESQSSKIGTLGFAGFFGIAAQHASPASTATNQCPVLLEPQMVIAEAGEGAEACRSKRLRKSFVEESIKRLQGAAVSGFAFVESWGLSYLPNMVTSALRPTLRKAGLVAKAETSQQTSVACDLHLHDLTGKELPIQDRIDLADSILKNLGLRKNFGSLVVFCGHASATANNPLRASLDCGACGGHSGESNAKMAATLLNSPEIRSGLRERGCTIPDQTHFMAAVHNTTTDELEFLDTAHVPDSLASQFATLSAHCRSASALASTERTKRFNDCDSGNDLALRSLDWSETRPEWGLAGNAAFVVAPRERTQQLKMGGRVFLHSYQHLQDTGYSTLELILTAPMVVTNWINMQYYASVVDNKHYGCGNKTIHNVVGKIGVLEGNGGDLRSGLALQSIHDGEGLQHEPLRLQVFVEAPREAIAEILSRHQHVEDLASNGWLHLHCIESSPGETIGTENINAFEASSSGDRCYRYLGDGQWHAIATQMNSLPEQAGSNGH